MQLFNLATHGHRKLTQPKVFETFEKLANATQIRKETFTFCVRCQITSCGNLTPRSYVASNQRTNLSEFRSAKLMIILLNQFFDWSEVNTDLEIELSCALLPSSALHPSREMKTGSTNYRSLLRVTGRARFLIASEHLHFNRKAFGIFHWTRRTLFLALANEIFEQ